MQDVVVLGDGSSLVITGFEPSAASTHSPPEEGTLSTVQEVQSFVSEAIAAGITFELLKTLVLSLARGGHLKVGPTATADDVRNTLQRYFLNAGYDDIDIKEIRQVDGQGWIGKGSVDTQPFHAVSDESAHIVHVRIQ